MDNAEEIGRSIQLLVEWVHHYGGTIGLAVLLATIALLHALAVFGIFYAIFRLVLSARSTKKTGVVYAAVSLLTKSSAEEMADWKLGYGTDKDGVSRNRYRAVYVRH